MSDCPRLHFGISSGYTSLKQLYASYTEAMSVLQLDAIPGFGSFRFYDEEQVLKRRPQQFAPLELEKQLMQVLFMEAMRNWMRLSKGLCRSFASKGIC